MAIDPDYAQAAAKFGENLNPTKFLAEGINRGAKIVGDAVMPGAGDILSGGGKPVEMGSTAPNLSLPQATPAPSNMQGGQFGGNIIETTGSLKPAATAAPAALEAGASAAKAIPLI